MTNAKLAPIHLGEMLREEFLIPLNLTAEELAKDIEVDVEEVQAIVAEKKDLSPLVALRLSLYFDLSVGFWLNLQKQYELECLQDKAEAESKIVHPYHKTHPTRPIL